MIILKSLYSFYILQLYHCPPQSNISTIVPFDLCASASLVLLERGPMTKCWGSNMDVIVLSMLMESILITPSPPGEGETVPTNVDSYSSLLVREIVSVE